MQVKFSQSSPTPAGQPCQRRPAVQPDCPECADQVKLSQSGEDGFLYAFAGSQLGMLAGAVGGAVVGGHYSSFHGLAGMIGGAAAGGLAGLIGGKLGYECQAAWRELRNGGENR